MIITTLSYQYLLNAYHPEATIMLCSAFIFCNPISQTDAINVAVPE